MAGQPLSPATDRRHGGPLPHHLANAPQAHPVVLCPNFHPYVMRHTLLSGISKSFDLLSQSTGQVAYVLLTRSLLEAEASRSTCMY